MVKVLLINGINMNLLGIRKPEIYGKMTLEELEENVVKYARENNIQMDTFQSNFEGEIVEKIHFAREKYDAIILNAAAHTHYSYGIRDAIEGVELPTYEVHLSDIENREDFRKISVIRDVCKNSFWGEGINSYYKAVLAIKNDLGE